MTSCPSDGSDRLSDGYRHPGAHRRRRRRAGRDRLVTLVAWARQARRGLDAAGAGLRDSARTTCRVARQGDALAGRDLRWHFIGGLQSNKVKYWSARALVTRRRASLLDEIARVRPARLVTDVRRGERRNEDTKSGWPRPTEALVRRRRAPGRAPAGLMGIPPFVEPEPCGPLPAPAPPARRPGRRVPALGRPSASLSMGMSSDLEVAVEEGPLRGVGTDCSGSRRRRVIPSCLHRN